MNWIFTADGLPKNDYAPCKCSLPDVIYGAGSKQLFTQAMSTPRIAIVGARRASAYGRDVAYTLGLELAKAGYPVVSDLALGVAGAATRGALAACNTPPITVLPYGPTRCYPPSHRRLLENVLERANAVSVYPDSDKPRPPDQAYFNPLLVPLASYVLVVEATHSARSARYASLVPAGRLCAVPGPVNSPLSQLPNDLIVNHVAKAVRGAEDVLAFLPQQSEIPATENPEVLAALAEGPMALVDLHAATSLALPLLGKQLFSLVNSGAVSRLPGSRFGLQ